MTRYGIYYAPAADSPLWEQGATWLGRDAAADVRRAQPTLPAVPAPVLERFTASARRYGFHATLKAPFRLAEGFTETHLESMAAAFAASQQPVGPLALAVRPISGFLALRPVADSSLDALSALAMHCTSYFDVLRAAPGPAELARRRRAGLSERQEVLLQRWGYPYTEEQYRFHMTLTDALDGLDADTLCDIQETAERWFAPALAAPLLIDAITIFREEIPGAPFQVWKRFPFAATAGTLPASGQLYYCVGPSGAGKDSLLRWVRERLPGDRKIVFAQRTITRAPHPSEDHEAVSADEFWRLAAAGHFCMQWQANDLCYGIRRGIEAELRAGRDVVVNGSREYLPQLQRLYPDARIVWIEADDKTLQERMAARQREQGAALLRRLERVAQFAPPASGNVIRIDNTGPLEVAGTRLLDALSGAADA